MCTAQRDPPPIGEPEQRSDMLTTSDVNAVTVTLADTPSQSNAAESPSKTARPTHRTKLLLAGTVDAKEEGVAVTARSRQSARDIRTIVLLQEDLRRLISNNWAGGYYTMYI